MIPDPAATGLAARSGNPRKGRRVTAVPGLGVCHSLRCVPPQTSPSPFAEKAHNITRWTEFGSGGHFPALEVPDLLTSDIRAFFGSLTG